MERTGAQRIRNVEQDKMRHIIALLISAAFYIPDYLKYAPMEMYFQLHSLLSIFYAILIYQTRIREVPILILIECISVIYTTLCYVQWFLALRSQWFYDNFENIMAVCFLAEIIVIMIGASHGGVRRIISAMRLHRFYDDHHD